MSNSKYQEAKSNIVNTLVRQIGYEAYKNLYSEDFDTLQELVDKATPKNPILVTHGKVKMTAKDMFEELGFEYKKYNEDFAYEYIENGKTNFVHFITERQTYCTNVYHVLLQLHNAITAQMKELERI